MATATGMLGDEMRWKLIWLIIVCELGFGFAWSRDHLRRDGG